jgi:hypothetical protein
LCELDCRHDIVVHLCSFFCCPCVGAGTNNA